MTIVEQNRVVYAPNFRLANLTTTSYVKINKAHPFSDLTLLVG